MWAIFLKERMKIGFKLFCLYLFRIIFESPKMSYSKTLILGFFLAAISLSAIISEVSILPGQAFSYDKGTGMIKFVSVPDKKQPNIYVASAAQTPYSQLFFFSGSYWPDFYYTQPAKLYIMAKPAIKAPSKSNTNISSQSTPSQASISQNVSENQNKIATLNNSNTSSILDFDGKDINKTHIEQQNTNNNTVITNEVKSDNGKQTAQSVNQSVVIAPAPSQIAIQPQNTIVSSVNLQQTQPLSINATEDQNKTQFAPSELHQQVPKAEQISSIQNVIPPVQNIITEADKSQKVVQTLSTVLPLNNVTMSSQQIATHAVQDTTTQQHSNPPNFGQQEKGAELARQKQDTINNQSQNQTSPTQQSHHQVSKNVIIVEASDNQTQQNVHNLKIEESAPSS